MRVAGSGAQRSVAAAAGLVAAVSDGHLPARVADRRSTLSPERDSIPCPHRPHPARRITAVDIAGRKGGEPIVVADRLSRPYGLDPRQLCRLHAGRRFARHGHARAGDDGAGDARHDDPAGPGGDARLEAGAGRRRHAVRLLRGEPRAGLPQRRPRPEGDRLRRGQARGRRPHGRDGALPGRAAASR